MCRAQEWFIILPYTPLTDKVSIHPNSPFTPTFTLLPISSTPGSLLLTSYLHTNWTEQEVNLLDCRFSMPLRIYWTFCTGLMFVSFLWQSSWLKQVQESTMGLCEYSLALLWCWTCHIIYWCNVIFVVVKSSQQP